MVELSVDQLVDLSVALAVQVAMVSHAVSVRAKSAPHAASDVAVAVEMALCLTSVQALASMFKRLLINTSVMEAISTWCGRGETSLVS